MFRSGNIEHPEDRFHNTTIEVLPVDTGGGGGVLGTAANESGTGLGSPELNATTDGYVTVGAFDQLGVAEGSIPVRVGNIREMRLRVLGEAENWVILNEVSGRQKSH